MALTVYGSAFSPFVARVMMAANAKGIKYNVTMPKDGLKSPEFLALNPLGKMPVLVDGKTAIYESAVIVEYLDAKGKAKPLVPKSAKGAAPVRLVATLAAEYVQPPGLTIFRHWRSKSTDAAALAAAQADLAKGLDVLEKTMARGKYAGGARFSLADVFVAPAVYFAISACDCAGVGDPIGKRPKLKAYWKRIQKDKAVAPVLAAANARLAQIVAGG